MSMGAQPASGIATYRILRELGARSRRSYAAIREPHELVVVHRFAREREGSQDKSVDRDASLSPEQLGLLLRDAQCLAKNWHPNIARIKHVDLLNGDLTVASELVDGSTLADLFALVKPSGRSFPLDVLVRVLLDVLAGIHGIHGLRDGRNVPLGAIHGELCPTNIVVGRDGVARIINTLRPRPLRIAAGSEGVGYAAPETLDGGVVDGRADVHAVGVILWEALTGKRLHDETDPARVLSRQREVDIPRPILPPGSPYAALADIAMRALAFDPALRFRTAAGMASELRKLPASKIATGSVVASRVVALDGDRIRRRRVALDPTSSGSRRRASHEAIAAVEVRDPEKRDGERAAPGGALTLGTPSEAFSVPRPQAPRQDDDACAQRESEPPPSIELVDDVSPDTAREERVAPRPPPVPPRVAARPIEERITVTGAPASAGSLARPASASSVDERVTVPGGPAASVGPVPEPSTFAPNFEPPRIVPASPVAIAAPPPLESPVVHGTTALDADPAPFTPVAELARSTSTAVTEGEPATTESDRSSVDAGVMAAGVLESLDGVDVPQTAPKKRRRRVVAIAAVLLLAGVLVVAFRSGSRRTASQGAPPPTEVATSTTAPLAPPTSTPLAEPNMSAVEPAASTAPAPVVAPVGPESTPVDTTPRAEPAAVDAPKPSPRPQNNRRYEPLGI